MNDQGSRVWQMEMRSSLAYRKRLGTDLLLTLASDPVGEGDVPLEESDGGTYKIYPPVDIGLFTSFKQRTYLHYHASLPLCSFSQ